MSIARQPNPNSSGNPITSGTDPDPGSDSAKPVGAGSQRLPRQPICLVTALLTVELELVLALVLEDATLDNPVIVV
jgi:hypothetical protein